MNVLMFGWEYPPSRSGGLGTACHGLSEALAAQGVGVRFVVPTAPDTPNRRPATLLTADEYIHGAAPVEPPAHPAGPTHVAADAGVPAATPQLGRAIEEMPAHLVAEDATAHEHASNAGASDHQPEPTAATEPAPSQLPPPASPWPPPTPPAQIAEPRHLEVAAAVPQVPVAAVGSPAHHRSPPPGATVPSQSQPAPAGHPPMALADDEPLAPPAVATPVDDPGDSEFPPTATPSPTAVATPDESFPISLPIGRAPHPVLVRLTLLRDGFELLEVPSPLTPYLTLQAYREELRRLQDAEAATPSPAPAGSQPTRSVESQTSAASTRSAATTSPAPGPGAPTPSQGQSPAQPQPQPSPASTVPSAPSASAAPVPQPEAAPAAPSYAPPAPTPAPAYAPPSPPSYAPPSPSASYAPPPVREAPPVRAARAGLGAERRGPPAPPWAPPEDPAPHAPEHAPNLLRVPIGYGPDLFSEVARLAYLGGELGRRGGFDVVHVHDWMTFMAGTEAKLKSGKTLVVHVHSTEYDRTADKPNPDILSIERYGFKLADRIITVSHRTARQLAERYGIDPARITVVHNGVAAPRQAVAPPRIAGSSSPLVLFAGRITAQKGPIDFVEAAALVLQRLPDARFVMAGSGDLLPATIARIRALGIERHFQFTGFLEQHDLAVLFRLTDLYVMPSVSEPFGLTAVEALAQNVPVIISTTTGASEVLGDEVPQVPSGDVERLGATIIDLLIHPRKARDMVIRSRPAVARLTWTHAARQVINVYQALTGG